MKKGIKSTWAKGRAASRHVRLKAEIYETSKLAAEQDNESLTSWVNKVVTLELKIRNLWKP